MIGVQNNQFIGRLTIPLRKNENSRFPTRFQVFSTIFSNIPVLFWKSQRVLNVQQILEKSNKKTSEKLHGIDLNGTDLISFGTRVYIAYSILLWIHTGLVCKSVIWREWRRKIFGVYLRRSKFMNLSWWTCHLINPLC